MLDGQLERCGPFPEISNPGKKERDNNEFSNEHVEMEALKS